MTLTADFYYRRRRLGSSSIQDSVSDPMRSPNDAARLSRPSSQSSRQIIASALDALMGWEEGHSVAARGAASLRRSIEDLPLDQHAQLLRKCDRATLEKLFSLAREPHPDMFLRGLNDFSNDLGERGEKELAARLLSAAQQATGADPSWRNQIDAATLAQLQRNVDVLQGRSVSPESLLRGSVRTISDPVNLVGFAWGQAAFRSFRLMTLAGLSSSAASGFFTTGLAAQALAAAVGVAAEAPALTLSVRGMREILGGSQAQPSSTMFREILSNGINLSFLHLGGFASQRFFESFHGISALTLQPSRRVAMAGVSRVLFPQVGALGAMMVSSEVEAGFKGQDADFARLFAGSLTMLMQSYAGGLLFEGLQPRFFAAWGQKMEILSRSLPLMKGGVVPKTPYLPEGIEAVSVAGTFATTTQPRLRLEKPSLNEVRMEALAGDESLPTVGDEPRQRSRPITGDLPPMGLTVRDYSLLNMMPGPALVTEGENIIFVNDTAKSFFHVRELPSNPMPFAELMQPVEGKPDLFQIRQKGRMTFWRRRTTTSTDAGIAIHYLEEQTELQNLREQHAALQAQNEHLRTERQRNAKKVMGPIAEILQKAYFGAQLAERRLDDPHVRELLEALGEAMAILRPPSQEIVSTDDVLQRALDLYRDLQDRLPERDRPPPIRLIVGRDAKNVNIAGVEARKFTACVLQLLTNARDAMPNGGRLWAKSYVRDGFAIIEVTDMGRVGIKNTQLPHIFQTLTSENVAEASGGRRHIPYVQSLITSYRGKVEWKRNRGGATFRIVMPIHKGDSETHLLRREVQALERELDPEDA